MTNTERKEAHKRLKHARVLGRLYVKYSRYRDKWHYATGIKRWWFGVMRDMSYKSYIKAK